MAPLPSSAGDEPAVQYFDALCSAFEAATRNSPADDHHYCIAGFRVHLRFATRSLVPVLTPALAHLKTTAGAPDLTICLWDTLSTGVHPPVAPWREHYAVRGEIAGFNSERIYTVYEHESRGLSMLDRDRNLAQLWLRDAAHIPYWVRGSPLRAILHWWMAGSGRQLLHSAAVGLPSGGVLITGRSGSGKSTAALSCLEAGYEYVGDDYVIVRAGDRPYAWSIYNTAKLVPEWLQSFPRLAEYVDNPQRLASEKALIFLRDGASVRVASGLPLKAILVPRVTGQHDTVLRKASAATAVAALAPTTIFAHPRGGEAEFRFVAALARTLPAYVLECGTDLAQIPESIERLLSGGEV
jgi:hypothetical protein